MVYNILNISENLQFSWSCRYKKGMIARYGLFENMDLCGLFVISETRKGSLNNNAQKDI